MSKHLICRILMAPDATVHIAFPSKRTYACTPSLLTKVLSNPSSTVLKPKTYFETTENINPQTFAIGSIPGLTLLKIYSNLEIVCSFPQLFENLFAKFQKAPNQIIDLSPYINSEYCYEEKQLYMKFFCNFTNDIVPTSFVALSAKMTDEEKITALSETYNSSLSLVILPSDTNNNQDDAESSLDKNKSETKRPTTTEGEPLYTVEEAYKAMGYKKPNGLYSAIESNKVVTYVLPGSKIRYYIPESEIVRKQNSMKSKDKIVVKQPATGVAESKLEEMIKYSPKSIQTRIAEFSGLSSEIIKCFKTMEQYNFYLNNGYKEVHWTSRTALIIDVHPKHVSERFGISNAERMKAGDAPIIPGTDQVYEVHHVEQDVNAPFAVITYKDHKKHDGDFHKKSKPLKYTFTPFGDYKEIEKVELHDSNFATQEKKFWREYGAKYAEAGSFEAIEGYLVELDKKKKKDSKKKSK